MQPSTADLQAVLTSSSARRDCAYLAQMFAGLHIGNMPILTLGLSMSNPLRERHESFVLVAPGPVFIFFERRHYRVIGLVKVLRRVLIAGRIAAAHVAALKAQPQVNPLVIVLYAFLTAIRTARFQHGREPRVFAWNKRTFLVLTRSEE